MTIAKTCLVCGKPCEEKFAPFCCARCAQIDLGRWLSETYTVQTEEEPDIDEGRDT